MATPALASDGKAAPPSIANDAGAEAQRIINRNEAMKSVRQNSIMVIWDDCARYILQRHGNILTKLSPGQPQTLRIYDTTAQEALLIGAAGMLTHIMPAGEKWFRLSPKGKASSAAVKAWLDKLSDTAMSLIYSDSNFYLAAHENLIDSMCFGTSLLMLEEGKKFKLNFINIPVGTFCVEENDEGIVDTVTREWQWNARQAALKWGAESLGPIVRAAYESTEPAVSTKLFTFIHLIEPREGVPADGRRTVGMNRPIRSVYVCKEDNKVMDEGGYYEMPQFCSRFDHSNNESYGRSPGTQTMPEIKLVNAMERDLLVWIELGVKPQWLVPNESDVDQIDNVPDGLIFYDSSVGGAKPEQVQHKNNLDLGEKKTEQKRQRIRDAFYNKMFQMLSQAAEMKREKTAYEVQQMVAEQLVLFAPIFARYILEVANPMIERVVGIVMRNNLIEPPPLAIGEKGVEFEINYTSKIALAIKSAQNQAFATMLALVEQIGQLDPSVVNAVKWGDGVRMVATNVGLPSELMRTAAEADAITKQQQQAQEAQRNAETAKTAAQAAQALGPQAQQEAGRKVMSAVGTPTGKPGQAA